MFDAQQVDELAADLAALFESGQGTAPVQPQAMAGFLWPDPEAKLKEYLERARALAKKFDPDSVSVGVMIPFGAQISLSWDVKDGSEGQTRVAYVT